jgi:putative endonuclease
MHYVYILESVHEPTKKFVGRTADLRTRLATHNAGKSPHTAKHRPWNLETYHAFADRQRATAFERYLKSDSGREFCRRHWGVRD